MKNKTIVLSLFIIFINNALCQVTSNFNNNEIITANGRFNKNYQPNTITLTDFNIQQLLFNADNQQTTEKIIHIAKPTSVDIDFINTGQWITDGGYSYKIVNLKAPGAKTLSLNFNHFFLPFGTEMYLYNANGKMCTNKITSSENNLHDAWGSWPFAGDELTLEVKIPTASIGQLRLNISNIAIGFREIYLKVNSSDFGVSGVCEINVICPQGISWTIEKNAVALILSGNGGSLCTGTLIMNSCNTNRPFLLTANHSMNEDPNVSQWRFTFQSWSPTCTPSQNSTGVTYYGSTLRANWANSDFVLVELDNTPTASSGLTYAGWSRNASIPNSTTTIHHPRGDVMKISESTTNPTITGYLGVSGNSHWRVSWTSGVTESGSSGSALFDQNHRIIGQLHGGPSYCGASGNTLTDYYGRFDISWDGGGTKATRLKDWLDPSNSNTMTTNTANINQLQTEITTSDITGPTIFCGNTQQYSLNIVPNNTPVNWSVSQPQNNVSIPTITSNNILVTKNNDGVFTLKATINNTCSGQLTLSKEIYAGPPPTNPILTGYQVPTAPTSFSKWHYEAPNLPQATYDWYLPKSQINPNPVQVNFYTNTQNTNYLEPYVPCRIPYYIACKITNACGSSNISDFAVSAIGRCPTKPSRFIPALHDYSLTSNTITNTLELRTITISNWMALLFFNEATIANEKIQTVNIYNRSGELLITTEHIDNKNVTIDISSLPQGSYNVEVVGLNDYKELHTIHRSVINSNHFLMEDIATGNIPMNVDYAEERLYVMQQKLFTDLQSDPLLVEASPVLQEFAANNASKSFGTIYQIEFALGNNAVGEALATLDQWQTTNEIDENFKNYYQLYLKVIQGNTLSEEDNISLYNIAQKCPLVAGEIVYAARTLYHAYINTNDDFANACSLIGARGVSQQPIATAALYPNPATSSVNITAKQNIKQIRITNQLGQVLQQINNINKTAYTLSLALYKNGIYTVQITNSITGKTETQKLIINN